MYSPAKQHIPDSTSIGVHKTLFDAHFEALFFYGMKLCKNREEVIEAIKKVFITLSQDKTLKIPAPQTRVLLFREVRLRLLKTVYEKDSHRKVFHLSTSDFEVLPRQAPALVDALNQLSSAHREVLYLKHFSQLSSSEIAIITSLSTDQIDHFFLECMMAVKRCMS